MTSTAVAEDDPDAFPRPFGQYLLLENFARGGMGEVYLAKSGGIAGLEKYCVLKKLRSELTRDREYVTRFIDEARVVVTLQHANICHVFDVGRVHDEYYLAMEYISGRDVRTLQDRSRTREKPMAPSSALQIVCETLEALDYAHRRNHPLTGEPLKLVHRDVSPQNVLVSYEGEVKLIDFGLAASKLKVERTQPNVVMGKMAYMAPEQARGDPIDARADLFACGVMLYELIAGERFYEGMTANDIWQVAGKGGFTPRKWDQIDRDLAKHIAKALAPDPKKRFATCGDFRDALSSHLHWRFPGSGVRGLREMMCDVFSDELRRESEMLARFGTVTVARFQTEFEESRSQSVSLARADETSPTVVKKAATQLVRDEQSQSSGAVMPPPDPSTTALASRPEVATRDVHQDPTRIAVSAKNQATQIVREKSLDKIGAAKGDTALDARPKHETTEDHPKERELTMRVARSRGPSGPIEDRTSLSVDRPGKSRAIVFAAVAAVAVAAVVVVLYKVTSAEPAAPVVSEVAPPAKRVVDPPAHVDPPVHVVETAHVDTAHVEAHVDAARVEAKAPPPHVDAPDVVPVEVDKAPRPDKGHAKHNGTSTTTTSKKTDTQKPDKTEHAATNPATTAGATTTTTKPDAKVDAKPNPETMSDNELIQLGRRVGCGEQSKSFEQMLTADENAKQMMRNVVVKCIKRAAL